MTNPSKLSDLVWCFGGAACVRAARGADYADYARLMDQLDLSAEIPKSHIEDGGLGRHIRQALEAGNRQPIVRAKAQAEPGGTPADSFVTGLSLILVADLGARSGVGVLQAFPPLFVMSEMRKNHGWPLGACLSLGARAAKLSALSIEPSARSQGVGRALAYACCESYFGAGYRLVYGFYRKSERDLSEFYRSVGFNIARLGERIPVGVGDGYRTVDIGADPDQGMFYIKMSDWKAGRMKPPRGLGR